MHGAHNTCRNACILSARNIHAPVHAHLCNRAEACVPWKLLRSIMQAVVCLPFLRPVLLSRPNPSSDAVLGKKKIRPNPRYLMTRSPLRCCTSIIRPSALSQASSSLSMVRTRAWLRTSSSTKFYFCHGFRGLRTIKAKQVHDTLACGIKNVYGSRPTQRLALRWCAKLFSLAQTACRSDKLIFLCIV